MSISLSFRTEENTRQQLDQVAESLDRNRNWVINAAIENYLDLHRWQLEHIEQGIRDSDEGRTHSTAEIRARLHKRHTRAKKKVR
jgi:predicted transcriptional regulator